MWRLWSIRHIPRTCHSTTFPVSANIKCSERTMIPERRGSNCKGDESTDRDIANWFPGMLPKALRALAKVCHCPIKLIYRKRCANLCKFTYFCVINQLRYHFEAICVPRHRYSRIKSRGTVKNGVLPEVRTEDM
jgi:hypothetical protein